MIGQNGEANSDGDGREGAQGGPAWQWSRHSIAILGMLVLTNVFNFIDRQLPYILADRIKHDLLLSDTQLGVLGGAAFAVVYAVLGLPLAHLADRHGGRWVLSGCVFVWSLATSLGGLAQNFMQLAITRLGVAIGEAGATPIAHGVVSAHFRPERRGFAIAVYSVGVPIGTMIGMVLGGWLGTTMSWRTAFMLMAAPGMLLAVACAWVLRDLPQPDSAPGQAGPDGEHQSMLKTLRFIMGKPALRQIFCAVTLVNMNAYCMIAFGPAFYGRTFGLSPAKVGLALGLLNGLAGSIGALMGGWVGQKLGRRDMRWQLWLPALGLLLAMPFALGAFLSASFAVSIVCFAIPKLVNLLYLGPTFATVHAQVPARMRATSSAAMYFGMGLIGMSLGPLVVGLLSDALQPRFGNGSLRIALLVVVVLQGWSALHFWLASRHLGRNDRRAVVDQALAGAASSPEEARA